MAAKDGGQKYNRLLDGSSRPQVRKFKYYKNCKLPTCGKRFGTNREWTDFCPGTNHQQEYHKLLRRKHEDVIVEIAALKENVIRLAEIVSKNIELISALADGMRATGLIRRQIEQARERASETANATK
jgi:hypothetical protein